MSERDLPCLISNSDEEMLMHQLEVVIRNQADSLAAELKALTDAQSESPSSSSTHVAKARQAYKHFCGWLNETIGSSCLLPPAQRAALGALAGDRLAPFVAKAPSASRWKTKPRGYAGDDVSIQMIYDYREDAACDRVQTIDSLFLGMSAAQAVRNRREILRSRITSLYKGLAGMRPMCVTTLAAGPAAEVFDAWESLDRPSDLHACLVDGDPRAVEGLKSKSMAHGSPDRDVPRTSTLLCAAVRKANLAHVALGRYKLHLPPQDLVYSLGLSDYLKDDLVVKLLDRAYELLRPGGTVIIGNFHESNPDRACLDHVIEWRLIHRSEDDMHRLLSQSRFGSCAEIIREPTGVQMLCVGIRPPHAAL